MILREWEKLRETEDSGGKMSFDGYIKSKDQYDEVSTKLLRCLETNCPSAGHHFTHSAGVKKHLIRKHFKRRDGETNKRYLARKAAAQGNWKWREKYVAMIADYRSLGDLVVDKAD